MHFIVGTGRCGSSLVHEILSRHEDVGFISNVDDNFPVLGSLGRFNNALYGATGGAYTRKGRLRFAPSEAYKLISREVSPIYENSSRDLEQRDVSPWLKKRFRDFFSSRALAQGKACFLHKYTGWPRMGFFAEIFPEARFVNVVRDGRAVANSWLQMPWWGGYRGPENWLWGMIEGEYRAEWLEANESYVTLAGISWKVLMGAFEIAAQRLPRDRYMEIRYEDFLEAPEDTLKSVVDFLGMRWTDRFKRILASQKLDGSRSRAFERDLTPSQLLELESSLSSTLARYGYK